MADQFHQALKRRWPNHVETAFFFDDAMLDCTTSPNVKMMRWYWGDGCIYQGKKHNKPEMENEA